MQQHFFNLTELFKKPSDDKDFQRQNIESIFDTLWEQGQLGLKEQKRCCL